MASMIPTRKVGGGAIGGSLTTILISLLSHFGYEVDADVAAALAVLVTFAVSYIIPEKVDAA